MRILAVTLGFFVLLAVGCGGGGEDEQKSGEVNTTSALRCSINMEGIGYGLVKIPAHCGVVRIDGDSFITDQRVIHLSGSSFGPETDNCSDPSLPLAGSICLPIFPGGDVHWQNLSNGVSGDGSIGYYVIGFLDPDWYFLSTAAQGSSGWSTHNTFTDSKGIELAMGANSIQISVDIQNNTGTDEITIIRIPDVTSPSVYNVEPEPDGIYYFRVLVFFDEQLDPDSVENALQVIDSLGQPTTGMAVYDPLKLTLEWRPADTLSRGAIYTARLSDIADLAGNKMIATYEWSFTVY
jgi:hypothetical protein